MFRESGWNYTLRRTIHTICSDSGSRNRSSPQRRVLVRSKPVQLLQQTDVSGLVATVMSFERYAVRESLATNLPDIHLVEAKTLQHARDRASRVVGSGLEDSILQRGLQELALRFFADFTFEVWVWRRE